VIAATYLLINCCFLTETETRLAVIFCTDRLHVYVRVWQCLSVCISYCLCLSVYLSVSVCLCITDGGESDNVAVGTTEEEIALDPEFSDYVDVEGRSTDYTAAASDADLLTDGLRGSELPGAPSTVHRSLDSVSHLPSLLCFR